MGAKMETLTEKMMLAQKKAFLELRQMVSLVWYPLASIADEQVVDISSDIQQNAGLVDELDLALSFAQTAVDSNYVRPKLTSSYVCDPL
jgi:DNA mismatch repair ATPase MutS